MKAAAAAGRRTAGSGALTAPGKSGAGATRSGHRAPAGDHESQAQRAAHAFARAEGGLSAGLTPAASAHFALPGSRAEALSPSLQQALEHAFDADLGALRIHRDGHAAQAAHRAGADAFAAGTHLFFAAGQFAPDRPEGQLLIAHEVAHALQQSARRSHGGRWTLASALSGSGALQLQPSGTPTPASRDEALFEEMAGPLLAGGEAANARAGIEMARAATALAPSTRGRFAPGTEGAPVGYGAALVTASRSASFNTLHGVSKGFIVDGLKLMGYYARAQEILQADTRFEIRISRWSNPFVAFLKGPQQRLDWTGVALVHAEFRNLWPDFVVQSFRRFILRPHTDLGAPSQRIARDHADAVERYETAMRAHQTIPQETVVLAWALLDNIALDHHDRMSAWQQRAATLTGETTPMHQRVSMLLTLQADLQPVLDAADSLPHQRQYAEALLSVINELLPFWQTALTDFESLRASLSGSDTELSARLTGSGSPPVSGALVTAIHNALLPAIQNLFATSLDNELPSAEDYQRLLTAFSASLTERFATGRTGAPLLEQLDEAVADEYERTRPPTATRGRRAPPAPSRARLRGLMTLQLWLDVLRAMALRYQVGADTATPNFADERGAHRIRLARVIAMLGRWMRWGDVINACEPVLSADFNAEVQLWLVSDWEPSSASPISQLGLDFSNNLDTPFPGFPFTARHLMNWFRLDYNRQLARKLDEILRQEDRLPADGNLHLERLNTLRQTPEGVAEVTNDAERQLAAVGPNLERPGPGMALTMPQRFFVADWELSRHPAGNFDWAHTIATHLKTQVQLEAHLDVAAGPAGDAERADIRARGAVSGLREIFPTLWEQGVFAWVLPSLVPMIRALANLPPTRDATLDAETAWLRSVDPSTMTPDQWERFDRHVRYVMETPLRQLLDELPDRLRRLTALRRRVLTPQWRDQMRTYTGMRGFESGAELAARIQTPQTLVEAMSDFERVIRPSSEVELQMGLVMLSLAPQIEAMAGRPLDAAYFNQYVYAFVISTLAIVDDPVRLAAMRRCATHVEDEAGNIVFIPRRLSAARTQLQSAKEAMDRAVAEAQGTIGFSGSTTEGPQGSITPLSRATPIFANDQESQADTWRLGMTADATGHIDYSTGTRYQILRVHRNFRYLHSIGSATPEGLRPGSFGPHAAAQLVFDEGDTRPATGEPRLLFTMLIDGIERPVTEDDLPLLARLNDIFLWRSFGIGMENSAALSQAAMQWIITVVGIVQPELAYAELAVNLARMAAGHEFDELVSQLYHDPMSLVEEIYARLTGEVFRADHLWRFFLLNSDSNPLAVLGSMVPTRTRAQSHPPTTRLGRVVAALRDIGTRIANGVQTVKRNTQGPLRSAQASISMRPRLAWLLLRAADFVAFIGDQVPPTARERLLNGVVELATGAVESDTTDGSVLDSLVRIVREQITETGNDMEQSTRRLLEGLAHFELPAELINLELATELILQFVLDRFGPRARAYRLIMELFPIPEVDSRTGGRFEGMTSLYQWLSAQIAGAWRDTAIDPNRYWRDTFMPVISDKFGTARDELVDQLYDASDFVLDALHGDESHRFPRPTGLPATEVEPVLLDPAVQAGPEGVVRRSESWSLPMSPGEPMPDAARADFEDRFGVSFRHVRLHDGDEGRAATEPIGARAVTSGSHIYRHPDQSMDSREGMRLLGHELAHVVQQLGPFADRPDFGRPGAGLLIDVAAERSADRVADQVTQGRSAGPLPTAGARGAQPSFDADITRDILSLLSTTGSRAAFTAPAGGTTVPGITEATALWRAVHDRLEHVASVSFAAFMHEGATQAAVQTVLRNPVHVSQVEAQLPGIANLAQRSLPGRRRSRGVTTELDAGRFVNLLEGYLFAAFGIAMQIATDTATHQTLTGLTITNVDLGQIDIDHALWDLAMRAFTDGDGAIRRELHQRLSVMGPSRVPQPGLFAIDSFRFSTLFVEDYRSLTRSRPAALAGALPTAADYVRTGASDNRGLALNTHGNLKGRSVSTYKRESHHMSQYLLAQFFANVHDRRFVPPGLRDAVIAGTGTGLDWDGNVVRSIGYGARRLQATAMDVTSSERGAHMPAILLAARTHKRGRLHIEAEAQWNGDSTEATGTMSQGNAIRNTFNAALPRDLRTDDDSPEQAARIRAWYAAPANVGKGARPYYDAAVATYHWMYGRMMRALETALQTEERAYYLGVAAIQHPDPARRGEVHSDYRLTAGQMTTVFNAAKRYHDTTMQTQFGWPTP